MLRLRFEVDYLSHGGNSGPAGPEEEEVEELEERELQLEEAEAALQVGLDTTCQCCMTILGNNRTLSLLLFVDQAWP